MQTSLNQFSTDLADVVSNASPKIVRVEARQRIPASGIVWSGDGIVVTANHIVEYEDGIRIGLEDGSDTSATVVGRDPSTDLIVLRADANDLSVPEWADDIRVGSLAMAIGRPHRDVEASIGTLSAVGGAWRTHTGARVDRYIRPDVTMYPGFSGGALVMADGSFAGLNTSALLHHSSTTVPAGTLNRIVETIVEHGRVPRGYLGIGVQPVRLSSVIEETAGVDTGLMVMSVEDDSPAESAGIRQGDILIAVNGDAISSVADLRVALSSVDADTQTTLGIVRNNEVMEILAEIDLR